MGPALNGLEIPDCLATPADRARYCRNRVGELLRKADHEHDQNSKFELLNLAERWMTLAFHHQRQTH
jgi:hypothetical protein